MSNKIDSVVVIFLLLIIAVNLEAFIPQSRDFASEYQYRLYRSWKTRERVKHELPARITHDKIERSLQFEDSEVEVVYFWKNWKINLQMENLPDWLPYSDYNEELTIAGELLYRLNCQHEIFAEHYLEFMPVELTFAGLQSGAAADSLSRKYYAQRIPVKSMVPVFEHDKMVQLNFMLMDGSEFGFEFMAEQDYTSAKERLYQFELNFPDSNLPQEFFILSKQGEEITQVTEDKSIEERSKLEENQEKIDLQEVDKFIEESSYKDIAQEPEDSIGTKYEKKLINYLENHKDNTWGRELLNNKIAEIDEFLQDEFPEHSMLIKGNNYNLTHIPFDEHLPADLYLTVSHEDGWNITAENDVNIEHKIAIVGGFEEFDLSSLRDYEAESICNYLPQLLISHRVMTTRLSGFLIEPDAISTTLVVNGSQRKIYSIDSYSNLLMLLGNFWEDRTIYYTVNDFKIVDGYIEFKGYMAAEDKEKNNYDLAEIRYKLDEDYRITLAMMVLYPQQHKKIEEGR